MKGVEQVTKLSGKNLNHSAIQRGKNVSWDCDNPVQ